VTNAFDTLSCMADVGDIDDEEPEQDDDEPLQWEAELLDVLSEMGFEDAQFKNLVEAFRFLNEKGSVRTLIRSEFGTFSLIIKRDIRPELLVFFELETIQKMKHAGLDQDQQRKIANNLLVTALGGGDCMLSFDLRDPKRPLIVQISREKPPETPE
jgi:hypothetical protein